MKYLKIPEPIEIPFLQDSKTGAPVKYDFLSFLNEWVWPAKEWRNSKDPEMQACALRLFDKLSASKFGDIVEIQDKDHEKLALIASLPNEKIATHLAITFMRMLFVITSATDNQPKNEK